MRLPMRVHDGDFDEEECEEGVASNAILVGTKPIIL